MIKNIIRFSITILLILLSASLTGQSLIDLNKYQKNDLGSGILHLQINRKKEFGERQNVQIISIPLEVLKSEYSLKLAWSDSLLIKTSKLADSLGAIAAVNAGFFNVKDGGSVTYLEMENERVSRRSWKGDPVILKETNLNGALFLDRHKNIHIETARTAREYLNSNEEIWVLVTGPVLIKEGIKEELLSGTFVENRHPRTCVGINAERLLLITVDGRNPKAKGMTLPELQEFLYKLGCTDAINLDGGGSTTMWLKTNSQKGVINCPSDNGKFDQEGERKVANALLLIKK